MRRYDQYILKGIVAPHVGAWIEIVISKGNSKLLKVAPHVGAWIEIPTSIVNQVENFVAPHVGAWIEIFCTPPFN